MIETDSKYGLLDFGQLGYMFAIEKIDPRQGKLTAYTETYYPDGEKDFEKIHMVDCTSLLEFEGDKQTSGISKESDLTKGFIRNKTFNPYQAHSRSMKPFVCPNSTSQLAAEGYYGSTSAFKYVKLRI